VSRDFRGGRARTKHFCGEVIAADERFDKADTTETLTQLESRGYIYFIGEGFAPRRSTRDQHLEIREVSLSLRLESLYNRPMGSRASRTEQTGPRKSLTRSLSIV
jgi:hypothetical protein